MIVSHEHRFIFIKTRKTAGTSIEISLSKECGPKDIITPIAEVDEKIRENLGYRGPQNYKINETKLINNLFQRLGFKFKEHYNHSPAKLIRKRIGNSDFNSYFKFCVVRNPWDRVVSLYYWRLNRPTHKLPKSTSLADFIQKSNPNELTDSHIYSIDGKSVVDRFIKYENLIIELNKCLNEIGINDIELPNAKSGTRKTKSHYSLLFDNASVKKIADICSWEIEKFGYEFDDKRE